MNGFNVGDKVLWQYTHQNGRSRFERVKKGKICHFVNHRDSFAEQEVHVHFEGNKTGSYVYLKDLRHARSG